MRVVNPSETNFTKYFPESMRTEEQNAALAKKDEERSSRSLTPEQRKLLDAERRAERLKEDNEFLRRLMESGKTPGRERGRGEDKLPKAAVSARFRADTAFCENGVIPE